MDAITNKGATAPRVTSGQALSPSMQLAVVIAFAVNLYAMFFAAISCDMQQFLIPWFDHIVRNGPVGAFADPFSDYTPPYLYLLALTSLAHGTLAPATLIKLLSLAGTGFLAVAVANLLKAIGAPARYAVIALVLPTVAINAALFGQCDAMWAGACVLATAAMIRGRVIASLLWCGVAIAFKAQAAFIAPFIIGALIRHRPPVWQWTIPALVYAALMAPAWLAGWPAYDLLTVYLRQASEYDSASGLANPWIWPQVFAPGAAKHFYLWGCSAAVAAAIGVGVLSYRSVGSRKAMLSVALSSAMALPFFLPRMHDRYYFLADVLSLALALALKTRVAIFIAVAMQIASLTSLTSYVFSQASITLVGSFFAAAALIATWFTIRDEEDRSPAARGATALA